MRLLITNPQVASSFGVGAVFPCRCRFLLLLLRAFADIRDETLDLVVRQFALVCRHFLAHTIRYAVVQLRVRLLLYVVGPQVLRAQLLPCCSASAPIVRVAYGALGFVYCAAILRMGPSGRR